MQRRNNSKPVRKIESLSSKDLKNRTKKNKYDLEDESGKDYKGSRLTNCNGKKIGLNEK